MESKNTYIGNDKFKKFLEHYSCPTPLNVVKLRFAGAICSPNTDLRPTDVITSLWEENRAPRLETKKEAELFFKFFMGLWDEILQNVIDNRVELPKLEAHEDLLHVCESRYELVELGFVEGFWGGMQDVKIPAYIAEIVDSLSRMALLYKSLSAKITPQKENKNVLAAISDCDKAVNKSISFLITHYVFPRLDDLQKKVN